MDLPQWNSNILGTEYLEIKLEKKKGKLLEYLSWDNKDLNIVFTMFMFIYQSLNCIIEITRTFCLSAFQNIQ